MKGDKQTAEYTYAQNQLIPVGASAIFNNTIPCNRGLIYHRNESSVFVLKGAVNNPCQGFARYQITFNGNISVPEGETAGPISISLALGGESITTSNAIVTPTVAEAFFNVTSTMFADIPAGTSLTLSVENTSTIPIDMNAANLTISRVA